MPPACVFIQVRRAAAAQSAQPPLHLSQAPTTRARAYSLPHSLHTRSHTLRTRSHTGKETEREGEREKESSYVCMYVCRVGWGRGERAVGVHHAPICIHMRACVLPAPALPPSHTVHQPARRSRPPRAPRSWPARMSRPRCGRRGAGSPAARSPLRRRPRSRRSSRSCLRRRRPPCRLPASVASQDFLTRTDVT
jgi:hypothetical protein